MKGLWLAACCALTINACSGNASKPYVEQVATPAQISVGKNIQVSAARPNLSHVEVMMAADPSDANRLMACSIAEWKSTAGPAVKDWFLGGSTVSYVSANGGETWRPAVSEIIGSWDPDCAYDSTGRAFFISATDYAKHRGTMRISDPRGRALRPFAFELIDRPFVGTFGSNEVAIAYMASKNHQYVAVVRTSRDGGRSFSEPLRVYNFQMGNSYPIAPGHPAFLSDGTLLEPINGDCPNAASKSRDVTAFAGAVELYERSFRVPKPSGCLAVGILSPGAHTIQLSRPIPKYKSDGTIGAMAVDSGSKYFKDRAYMVWNDNRTGRLRINVSYSTDGGRTWSAARAIDDAPLAMHLDKGPDNGGAAIAVNHDGVVGVEWEDRRDNPDDVGYYLRFSASLDGGLSWLPSVRVSEAPNVLEQDNAVQVDETASSKDQPFHIGIRHFGWITQGHTLGLAADPKGIFHALWVDDRSGVSQIWTSKILVNGTATKNGDLALANLSDVTNQMQVQVRDAGFNRRAGKLWLVLQLKNASKRTFNAVNLRIASIRSPLADIAQTNIILPFRGTLRPGAVSETRRVEFAITNIRPEHDAGFEVVKLLDLDGRVFARSR